MSVQNVVKVFYVNGINTEQETCQDNAKKIREIN